MMSKKEFSEILTSLLNGNAGAAEQEAETVIYDNTYNLSDDYDRIKQDRINYELAKFKRMCYNND